MVLIVSINQLTTSDGAKTESSALLPPIMAEAENSDRTHMCVADLLLKEKRSVAQVHAAVTETAQSLPHFSLNPVQAPVEGSKASVEVWFHTPLMRYRDIMRVEMREDGDNVAVHVDSRSSSFCPMLIPFRFCRPCCKCFSCYGDGGANQAHVEAFSQGLNGKIPHDLKVEFSSRP